MIRLLLASTSPQRRAILEQLGIPFDVIAPSYEEHDPEGIRPADAVRAHALGKARSVADLAAGRPVLGVDTEVVADGDVFGKPGSRDEAAKMLRALAGRRHDVVSGLCLRGDDFEEVGHDRTRVAFRPLSEREIASYLATGEWEGRAGAYAIQGRGAGFVERIEGDYLNVVGLPAALLLQVLARRFPGVYGAG
jgi:septum formation protein